MIQQRINIFKAIIKRSDQTKEVSLRSGLSSLFQIYGLRKKFIKRSVCTEELEDVRKIRIQGRTIYWPKTAITDRIVDMYFEVFENNNHRFDICGTEIKESDVVIDAGCCEGYFSMLALEAGASKIYCFEPGKSIINCLEKTFSNEIDIGRIELVPMLLGDKNSSLKFMEDSVDPTIGRLISYESHGDNCKIYLVKMTSLDNFFYDHKLTRIDYIKADVEGSELEVIAGAEWIIKNLSPRLSIAVYHASHHAQYLKDMILSFNKNYHIQFEGLVDFGGIVRPVILHGHVPDK